MTDHAGPAGVCQQCGRLLDVHNRHVRFRLPEPVLAAPDQERTAGTWMSHDGPDESVMMQVPGVGPFLRCLLAVRLSGGFTLTFGVWLGVSPDDLLRAFKDWWDPSYSDLTLNGVLANRLPLWDCLGSPAGATVVDPDQTPYVTSSPETHLARVLQEEWPHDEVLRAVEG